MAPDFDIKALDALVTMHVINVVVLEAEVEIRPDQVNIGGKGPAAQAGGAKGTSSVAVEEAEAVGAHSHIVELAFVEESIGLAPIGGSTEVAPAGENAEVAPTETALAETAD